MPRAIFSLFLSLFLVLAGSAVATTIPVEDLQSPGPPCTLQLSQGGSDRTLTWGSVSGASSYKVGYRQGNGTVVGLAELAATSYVHRGWDPNECLEYVVVAYDSGGSRICSAHVLNAGSNCQN